MLYVLYGTYGTFEVRRYICMENRCKNPCSKSILVRSVKIYTESSIKFVLR